MKKRPIEIRDYDKIDTTNLIDPKKKLNLGDLGFKLPPSPPSQVVSIRLPTRLLNEIRAKSSTLDIPYQALIKMILAKAIHR